MKWQNKTHLWIMGFAICFGVSLRMAGQTQRLSAQECLDSNKLVKKTLEASNPLWRPIGENQRGDGIVFPWMIKMKNLEIKHAVGQVRFRYVNRDLSLRLLDVTFHKSYYYFSKQDNLGLSPAEVKARALLQEDLALPYFIEASQLLRGVKANNGSCGTLFVSLLDDACLPVVDVIPTITECENEKIPGSIKGADGSDGVIYEVTP